MLDIIHNELQQFALPAEKRKAIFFKTGPGEYAEHDQFLGVPTPRLREIAKQHRAVSLEIISELLQSPINEARLLALMMLVDRYQKGNPLIQEEVFRLYCSHMRHINNWNLVDASAHYIIGAHLFERDKNLLLELSSSNMIFQLALSFN